VPVIGEGDLAKARANVLEQLSSLADKRRENRAKHKQNTEKLGPAIYRAAEYGWSYGEQAAHFQINSRMLYRHGGNPPPVLKKPRVGQLEKIKKALIAIFDERVQLDLEYEEDGKTMAKLARVAHNDLDVNLLQLQKASGVARSTFYAWLGLAHSNPKTTQDGKRTKKVDAPTVPSGGKRVLWKAHRDTPTT